MGKNHRVINSNFHPKEFFVDLWQTISSGQSWKGEIKNRAKDGSYYWVFTTIVPLMTPSGRPFKYFAIRVDITEQKMAQEQAELQRATLIHSEKMASVGELAAGIAHELGNPMAVIAGRMELLEMRIHSGKSSPEETLKTIATVRQLVDRMTGIIQGMTALSRDGSHDSFRKVSVSQLIRDVLGFAQESFRKYGIRTRFFRLKTAGFGSNFRTEATLSKSRSLTAERACLGNYAKK